MVRKALILLLVLSFAVCAHAQEDALCTWTTVTFDKTHGKFSVGLMSEYRHKFHEGASVADHALSDGSCFNLFWPNFRIRFAAINKNSPLKLLRGLFVCLPSLPSQMTNIRAAFFLVCFVPVMQKGGGHVGFCN